MSRRQRTKEKTWLASEDFTELHRLIFRRGSDRKSFLLGAAVCRQFQDLLLDRRSFDAIEAAEAFADARLGLMELGDVNAAAFRVLGEVPFDSGPEIEPGEPGYGEPNLGQAQFKVADAAHLATNSADGHLASGGALLRCLEAAYRLPG